MRAHAVLSTVSGAVVSVTELLGVNVVVLADERRGRRHVRNLVYQTDHVVSLRGNCNT